MKKILVFLAMFILMADVSIAQFGFGLKVGYNASKLKSDLDSITGSYGSGFHAGAFVRIGKKVYLQPEVDYTYQTSSFRSDDSKWEQKITMGTLDIPVLIGFKLIDAKVIKWRIMVGPEVSFLLSSNVKNVTLTGPVTSSDIHTLNWYGQAGTGLDILFLSVEFRYQFGLNTVINDATRTIGTTQTVYPLNSKNNMFLVSLGFKIL
jgi:hypothetical protein